VHASYVVPLDVRVETVKMRWIVLSLAVTAACGSSGGGGDDVDGGYADVPGSNAAMRFNPWEIGAKWSYKIGQPGTSKPDVLNRMTSVEAYEDVGAPNAGTMAFRVHQELYSETKDVWEVARGDLDVKYKTIFYNTSATAYETDTQTPYRLKLDESAAHTATGAQWSETFSETDVATGSAPATKSETLTWSVVSDAEAITVMAGTYTALHVRRVNPAKSETIDYWYARGVGRLKESGGGTLEELMSFTPAP
jgi:hypothetical protein